MQTTLLGLAIALILALLAALIGPSVVDWGRFRPSIEAEASRLIGAPVRITGPIEVAILPTPALILRGLEVGPSAASSGVRARSLAVELQLGSLVGGKWRAQQLHLVGPEFNLGLDGTGNLALPPIAPGFDPDQLSIDRLNIEDGHAVLTDSRSGSRISLDKLWFNGDVRSLAGPFRGEGAFVVAGDLYAFRIAAGRAEEGALKLRLNLEPVEKPLAVEADGTLSFAGTAPRFDGAMTVSRPAAIATPSGQTFASDPWRLTAKVKASASAALFEGVEFQYGPEERAVRLTGTAELKFGDRPRFDGILAAMQVDLDRAFGSANAGRPLPFAALKTLGDTFSGALRPAIPARIGVSIEALTLAGATIQNLRGDLRSDGEVWNLDGFELRVPGFTQVNLSGRVDLAPTRLGFIGPVSVDSTDPTALIAWLEGKSAQSAARIKPFRARGEVTLSSEKIAFDRLTAEIDRKWVEGSFAYAWAAGEKPARLDADLNAAELDVDALMSFADAARGATTFETPREVTLGLGVGRAVVAGVQVTNISARFRRDATGLHVERFSIGDVGGNAVDVSGRIDATSSPPQGALNVRLDARNLAGVVTLAEKFLPDSADLVRRVAQRMPSAQLNATLALEQSGAGKLALDGRSGDLRMTLRGEVARIATAAAIDLQSLAGSDVRLEGKIESGKGSAVLDLLNLGGVLAVEANRPGELNLTATGPLGALALDGRLLAGGLDASVKGVANLRADEPKADLRLTVANADARPLRRGSARPAPLPVRLTSTLALTGHSVTLGDFSGAFAAIPARGRLAIDFGSVMRVEGQIEADIFDAPAALAALVGLPGSPDARAWSAEPFGKGLLDGAEGRVELRSARVNLTPTLTLRQARGTLKIGPSEITFADIEGRVADGQARGQIVFHKRADGVSADGRLQLNNADAAVLLAGEGKTAATLPANANKPAVTGRVGLQLDLEGTGRSPQALIGSLSGNGMVSLSGAQFASLNAKVFETAARAVDQGVALDMKKISEIATGALESGTLAVPSADGVITIAHGQIRLTNLVTRAEGADLTVSGSLDLMEQNLSARLALEANKDASADRPVVSILLSGPLANPKRTVDVSALTAWLTLRAVEHQSKQLEAMEAKRRAAITEEQRAPSATPSPMPPMLVAPSAAPPILAPSSPAAPTLAPPLPPAIEIPSLPNIQEQRPAQAPVRAQRGTAAQPRSAPPPPLQLLPASPDN
ncbi:MAG TPA: AsmA family protein [Xanthobacteraceae bacterium]|nr:AsmA family protein [Xanthobacteraceae bacterium]